MAASWKSTGQITKPASSTLSNPHVCQRVNAARLSALTYDPFYRRALERQQSRRGKAGAHKVMLMAAVAFNLKKYMKLTTKATVNQDIAMKVE